MVLPEQRLLQRADPGDGDHPAYREGERYALPVRGAGAADAHPADERAGADGQASGGEDQRPHPGDGAGGADGQPERAGMSGGLLRRAAGGEWEYIIEGASSLNSSVEIIRELEKMKRKLAILTKVHSLKEMQIKVSDLRQNRYIYSPIIFVPPGVKKHEIIIPNNQLLIDDSSKNINGWVQNGGVGMIFDEKLKVNSKTRVRSLEFLLEGEKSERF